MKRSVVEELKLRKLNLIAAIHANSNYDSAEEGQEPPREKYVHELEDSFDKAVHQIYTGEAPEEDKVDWDDPFFATVKKGQEHLNLDLLPETQGNKASAFLEKMNDIEVDQ